MKYITFEELQTMTVEEIHAITWTMELITEELEQTCETCPLRDVCGQEELFWGCGAWEDSMGEDL